MGYLIGAAIEAVRDGNHLIQLRRAQANNATERVSVDKRFSIEMPAFLSPAYLKGEEASLHYSSLSLFIRYKVFETPKSDAVATLNSANLKTIPPFLLGQNLLRKVAVATLGKEFNLDLVKIEKCEDIKVNGLNALVVYASQEQTFFHGAIHGIYAFIEGEATLYIISITSNPPSVFKLAEKFERSINSFKEL